MKKRIYIRLSIIFFVLCVGIFAYGLSVIGLFTKGKVMVKALANNNVEYEVITGSFKLESQLPDTISNVDVSSIFISGRPNPFQADYTKTYNYFILEGRVTGLTQAYPNIPRNPIVTVSSWEQANFTLLGLLGILISVMLYLSFSFRRIFIIANKPGILELSLMGHEKEVEEEAEMEEEYELAGLDSIDQKLVS